MKIVAAILAAGLAAAGAACARRGTAILLPNAEGADGLVADKALVDGYLVEVAHSPWDGGRTADLFDEDPVTMARTAKANPAIVELRLRQPRPLRGVSLTTGGMEAALRVRVHPAGGPARTYEQEFRGLPHDPTFGLDFDTGMHPIERVRIELTDLNRGDGHVHIRTVRIL